MIKLVARSRGPLLQAPARREARTRSPAPRRRRLGSWRAGVGKLITPHDYPLGSLAVSGRTLVASLNLGVYVFTEPHRGWSGIVHPAAKLALKSSGAYEGVTRFV